MRLNGSQILIECLKEQGVDTVFGYPGGAVLNIYDELYRHQDQIKHILTCHEQGACHAADGYARATGKVGVCIATSGPGATNLVTGIATAYMDSVPLVAITGQVATSLLGKDSFQEVDITGITTPITKHNYIVKDVQNLADTIRKAFVIAKSGRPGPVLVDICKDVTADFCEYTKPEQEVTLAKFKKVPFEVNYAKKIAKLISNAKRPVILSGGGTIISNAWQELKILAEKMQIPVCTTMMGTGSFDCASDLYLGMIGMHGTKASNYAIDKSDLIIALGARFSDRVTSDVEKFAKKSKIIHIDNDPAEIGKNVSPDYYLIGDMREILNFLISNMVKKEHPEWISELDEKKNVYLYKDTSSGELKPEYIIKKVDELTKGDVIVVTEVGQNQIWAAQFFKYTKPRTFISSGGLGTMGYGLGAAIGAQFGCPQKRVVNFAGDGSFGMNLNELMTLKTYQLPIIEIILNNHVLGMVRQWQNLFYEKRFSNTTLNRYTDFEQLGKAFGITAFSVKTKEDFDKAVSYALSHKEPILINCEIEKDEMAFPIVPPGKEITEQIDELI